MMCRAGSVYLECMSGMRARNACPESVLGVCPKRVARVLSISFPLHLWPPAMHNLCSTCEVPEQYLHDRCTRSVQRGAAKWSEVVWSGVERGEVK